MNWAHNLCLVAF